MREAADLRRVLDELTQRWGARTAWHREQLLSRATHHDWGLNYGPFVYRRISSNFERGALNFIGEVIERDGRVEFLELFRLNHAQSRRAYLLQVLDDHAWDLEATAKTLQITPAQLIERLKKIGIHVHEYRGRKVRFVVWVWE